MTRKSGLGKGLDALIPSGNLAPAPVEARAGAQEIQIHAIQPNPRQPRSHFDDTELAELAESIRQHGIIQPLLVRQAGPENYTLIAGERRLLAARIAGLQTVPAIIREASDQQLVELALIENVQRADLSPLETADAYRQLAEEFQLTHEQISERVGKSRVAITNTLRLLKLPASVKQILAEGKISEGHARSLLRLPTSQAQIAVMQTILKKSLSVHQTEELVQKMMGHKPEKSPQPGLPPELGALEQRLREYLGTKVTLKPSRKGGTLLIHYFSDEDLNTLVERISGEIE